MYLWFSFHFVYLFWVGRKKWSPDITVEKKPLPFSLNVYTRFAKLRPSAGHQQFRFFFFSMATVFRVVRKNNSVKEKKVGYLPSNNEVPRHRNVCNVNLQGNKENTVFFFVLSRYLWFLFFFFSIKMFAPFIISNNIRSTDCLPQDQTVWDESAQVSKNIMPLTPFYSQ